MMKSRIPPAMPSDDWVSPRKSRTFVPAKSKDDQDAERDDEFARRDPRPAFGVEAR